MEVIVRNSSPGLSGYSTSNGLPVLIQSADDETQKSFIDFFTANIRNRNTRLAYGRAVSHFLKWCDAYGICNLKHIETLHISTWLEERLRSVSIPTAKQNLAAIKHLMDWLVICQIIPANPASSVRGPKHSVSVGKTPILSNAEIRDLLDSIDIASIIGMRDHALISLMTYSFSRISAALAIKLEDVYIERHRLWVRLHEKGGKVHSVPCHHALEASLRDFIDTAHSTSEPSGFLFQSVHRKTGYLTGNAFHRADAWRMVRRRCQRAGIAATITNHSFRATGITAYLRNPDARLEIAQRMALHSDPKTTRLYQRNLNELSLQEFERIQF